jgi:hypothetical protein
MTRIIAKAAIAFSVMSASVIGVASNTLAASASGNGLYAWCLSASRSEQGLCNGYILGIADAMVDGKIVEGFTACIPAPVRLRSPGQLFGVVKRFLASHPEKRQLSATGLVAQAFQERYPCP